VIAPCEIQDSISSIFVIRVVSSTIQWITLRVDISDAGVRGVLLCYKVKISFALFVENVVAKRYG